MTKHPVRPEDILADGVDNTYLNGMQVRKGTIAAFLANANILATNNVSEEQKQEAIRTMEELAPAVIATGLHSHVVFKNHEIEQILIDAAK